MGRLSLFDQGVVETLRNRSIIEHENGGLFHLDNGVIAIRCPDGDQMLDRIEHDRDVTQAAGGKLRVHLITHHGGCMVVAPDSPLYPGMGIDEYCLKQIREAEMLKEIHTITAEIHAPCGKAISLGLTLVHQIVLQMAAKPRIKAVDPTNKVICRLHVDHPDGRKRTYFISRAKWIAYWKVEGRCLWGHLFPSDPYEDPSAIEPVAPADSEPFPRPYSS
ncbi:hypothetical protein HZA87_01755 [Candidatus Uhrbacteria bacterium]|nr:hypothetical protein [Candidatus Uhrbacteria bacterium]